MKSLVILVIAASFVASIQGRYIEDGVRADVFTRTETFNENITATWTVDRKAATVKFVVVAQTTGYVGFGISDNGTMTIADLVIGGVNSSSNSTDDSTYFDDRYSVRHGVPVIDTIQNWHKENVTEVNGVTTLVFSRPFLTNDSAQDLDITDRNTNFIWAIGSSDDLTRHATRGFFAVNILEEQPPKTGWTVTEKFNDNFTASWTVDTNAKTVTFDLTVKTTGYIGFGIADSGTMQGADLIIAGVNTTDPANATTYFSDRYATGAGNPKVDDQQDWTLISGEEKEGQTTLKFSRPFVSSDKNEDVDITDRVTNFIWAIGATDNVEYHKGTRGKFEVNILKDPAGTAPTTTTAATTNTATTTTGTTTTTPPPKSGWTVKEKFNDNFTASWTVDTNAKIVSFDLTVKTTGYIGFGIADSGTMQGADLVIGGVDTSDHTKHTPYFTDRYANGTSEPKVDDKQDWTLISADEKDGQTTLKFSRPFVSPDKKEDVDITDRETNFIWAIGATDNVQYHEATNRGKFPVNILKDPTGGAVGLQISAFSTVLTFLLLVVKYF